MGRHSIPDPEESSGGTPEGASDATESFEQPSADDTDSRATPEPDYPSDGEPDADQATGISGARVRDRVRHRTTTTSTRPSTTSRTTPTCPTTAAGDREPEPPSPSSADPPPNAVVRRARRRQAPPRAQHSGEWEGGEWTGSHRAIQPGRRGVSGASSAHWSRSSWWWRRFILWRFFGDALSNRSSIASARCVDGQKAVAVIADPSIADEIATLAKKFNETAEPGRRQLRRGRRQARRIRPGDQRLRRHLARRAGRPPGAVDSRQLDLAGPPRGGRRRGNRQRQPLAGQLAGRAGHPPAAQRRSWRNRIGEHCPACRATRLAWTG